ncbi:uncharacterized protein LOC141804646 [Halichoeres trimaculatus]|uniref:uncharacterized protein LOC141804646 n=1 Tax=Halichoeres trimaculatus TaxID=147232 RepID=UPI003D9E7DBD
MSNTPVQEPTAPGLSSGSGQTLPSRPFQPISDPSASKRVCFYKSGDYTFSGHRMVINARTFKTYDALLDALSKKVPLPFGVRTITTPRGTHLVKALDDLHDGGSYVCSDQRRVKPLNLEEVIRRQVPWNTTRPFTAGGRKLQRSQFGKRSDVVNKPARVAERVAVRTPKRLEVIKNRDPSVRRTIVLQRRTAPTFDALLDYLSQILQFPVLKLFSTDGRRVDGLAALILCSGIVVAAGNEPFRLGNYNFSRMGQMAQAMYMESAEPSMLQPRALNNKSFSSGRGSRNFSLSSERYIVNQINKSRYGSTNGHLHRNSRSYETDPSHRRTSYGTSETGRVNGQHASIVPQDDDIEKSFRVNQDGSMTVEMKVRLTIKEEEMLHWTTTLSRTCLSKRTVCASISESGKSSTDSNNAVAKNSTSISGDELKEGNHPPVDGKGVKFNDERVIGRSKASFKRSPTPGAQQVKRASVESVKMVTESGVQESTLGHYSYMERTAGGETTEGYRVVRHSSSNRPIPKPRKTPSAGAINKGSHSSIRSTGVAEVLQIQNNGMEVTETVMHIYESQGNYDNYFANEEYSAEGPPSYSSTPALESKLSGDSAPPSSSNDCDIDFQQATTDSQQRQKEEMLSLSSEPITQTHELTNHVSLVTGYEGRNVIKTREKNVKTERKKIMITPARNLKSFTSTSSSDKKQRESTESLLKNGVKSSTEKLSSDASIGKKSLGSSGSAKSVQKSNGIEKPQVKNSSKDGKMSRKEQALLANALNVKRNLTLRRNLDNGLNVNKSTARPLMKKNISDILQPKKPLLPARKSISRHKSLSEHKLPTPKKSLELSESLSAPSFRPSLSEIHQYVENWLEKVSPDPVPYTEETTSDESKAQMKVVFQIGNESESDEKTEGQKTQDVSPPPPGDVRKSASCLTVPQCHEDPTLLHNEHYARGLCVSMPSVRVDPAKMENVMRPHKSEEAIGPADNESSTSSNFLSPHARIKPVLKQIYSSIQNIRGVSETTNTVSNLEKSTSLPDFPTQVASVFGSSCRAFLSFLSVVTLRDNLSGSEIGNGDQSRSDSEAMLMMQSLQKISAIEDTEEQRASLTDLQSRASSQLRARWKDFQILRERLESEPLSPRVSETEFALDVASEGGDVFEDRRLEIDELMEEMNMPEHLRAEISSTIQQSRFFYPVEESTFVDAERNLSESEEDVEKFVEDETEQSPEPDSATVMIESDTELRVQTTINNANDLDTGDLLNHNNSEDEEEHDEGDSSEEGDGRKQEDTKEIDEVEEESEAEERESEEEAENKTDDKGQDEGREKEGGEKEEDSVIKLEEGTEDEITEDEGEGDGDGLVEDEDQESRGSESVEETDEREGDEETEIEEEVKGESDEETEKEEKEDTEDDEGTEEEEREENEVEKEKETEETEVDGNVEEQEIADEETEEEEEEKEGYVVGREAEEEKEGDEVEGGAEEEEEDEVEAELEEEEKEVSVVDQEAEEGDEEEEVEGGIEVADEMEEEVKEESEVDHETDEEVRREDGVDEETDQEEVENVIDVEEEEDDEAEEGIEENEGDEKKGLTEVEELEEEEQTALEEEVSEEREEVEEVSEVAYEIRNQEEDDDDEKGEEGETVFRGGKMCDKGEENCLNVEKTEISLAEESVVEAEVVEGIEIKDKKQESEVEVKEESVIDDEESKNLLEEASYLPHRSSCDEDADIDIKVQEYNPECQSIYSSEVQCAEDKGDEGETDEGEEHQEERGRSLPHPVEISKELLDFVNSALQCASLIFTYDANGKIRIEPDNSRVVKTSSSKRRKNSSFIVKCLPSPTCSDLSDYRPETSESGGYQSQESVDIVSESGEEGQQRQFPVCKRKPKLTVANDSKVLQNSHTKSGKSFSSCDSGTKVSKDLSYFSAGSSQKADNESVPNAAQCISFPLEKDSKDGVLIDQGRWLLKENHLIRTSPPVALGMYSNIDSTSTDSRSSDESPPHYKTQHNLLKALSSSELEEMAKPKTPKCTYYNMPHGSDSDPFLDDSSYKSGKKDSSVKGRGVRVAPTINTSKTWSNKNGSLSSFASVEFSIPDRKVHPEGEVSSVEMARVTSGGVERAVQAQDSIDRLHLRCSQYCPIL